MEESVMEDFVDRYKSMINGVISCFDRVVITGTIPDICHAQAMSMHLRKNKVRIFDYPKWAEPLRDEIRKHAELLAQEAGLEIDFIRKNNFRKEQRIKEIIESRGDHPGLVHIFSAMEPCTSFRPWHNKQTGETYLRYRSAKCLHYYFYFIDKDLGLCYLRVPTWAPFKLQFYFNGHNLLASKLKANGIGYQMGDNAFITIEDFEKAQELADDIDIKSLHDKLEKLAGHFCPVVSRFKSGYHFSIMQLEYATDVVFKRQTDLAPVYEALSRAAIHTVKPENVATFLGKKLHGNFEGEAGNNFHTRIEGTRIKHSMGPASIKMYDKLGLILRIETTTNDVTFFKHHRRVEQRDGSWTMKVAAARKTIYSIPALAGLMNDSNRRYLEFISAIDDPTAAIRDLDRIGKTVRKNDKTYRGFNLFCGEDLALFDAIAKGEFNISGFKNKHLRKYLPGKTGHQISRLLARLRKHGLIKKIGKTYKYYLTKFGKRTVITALKVRRLYIIPSLQEAFDMSV